MVWVDGEWWREWRDDVRSLAKTLGVKAAEVKFSGGGARPKSENHE